MLAGNTFAKTTSDRKKISKGKLVFRTSSYDLDSTTQNSKEYVRERIDMREREHNVCLSLLRADEDSFVIMQAEIIYEEYI